MSHERSQNQFQLERHDLNTTGHERSPSYSSAAMLTEFGPSFRVDVKREIINEDDTELEDEGEAESQDRDCGRHDGIFAWPKSATVKLLELYRSDEFYKKFQGRLVKKKQLWNEITNILIQGGYTKGEQITWEHCSNKFRNLKKTYIECLHRSNNAQGDTTRRFEYFDEMHEIFGNTDLLNSNERSTGLDGASTDEISLDQRQISREADERQPPVFDSTNIYSSLASSIAHYAHQRVPLVNVNNDPRETDHANRMIMEKHREKHQRQQQQLQNTLERQNDFSRSSSEGAFDQTASPVTFATARERSRPGYSAAANQNDKDQPTASTSPREKESGGRSIGEDERHLVPSRKTLHSARSEEGTGEPKKKKRRTLLKRQFILETVKSYFDERKQENQQMICLFKEMLQSYKEMQTRQIAIFETFLTTLSNLARDDMSDDEDD